MPLLDKYLPRTDFELYEDFYKNNAANIPENFNFNEIKNYCDKAANVLQKAGIGKGDPVLLILERRWEYCPVLMALHKLGAAAISAADLLTTKDIVYRCNTANIKAIICVDDHDLMLRIDEAQSIMERSKESSEIMYLKYKAYIRTENTPEGQDPAFIVNQLLEEKVKTMYEIDPATFSVTDGPAGTYGAQFGALSDFPMPEKMLSWTDFSSLLKE